MRWLASLTAATVALSMAGLPALPSAAEATPASPGALHRVTLITGDVVTVEGLAGGKQTATVEPGKGREGIRFYSQEVDGELRITPADMVPYLAKNLVDKRLFDVGELIEQGYDDASSATLPLLFVYDGAARKSAALPGVQDGTALPSVNARAVAADKGKLSDLWRTVEPSARAAQAQPALPQGIKKIWLDGKVRASLEHSVPQVGAPEAWKAGFDGKGVKVAVLDTGIDQNHPDLAGKIAQTRNFTEDPSVQDGFGHGTHVASIIAGLGTASQGLRKGVAPGAQLMVGKVLDDSGSGTESEIIQGMEWATASGADVVNMSLGGGPTDGTDPLSVAVDNLTDQTGALFVIAAGNEGKEYSVGTPGAATSALTVGAVDGADALAGFSSRGPRLDGGLKPDITAPGVDIIAARAAGTSIGTPVGDAYTTLSGTSMATPHVAGAAAILKQEHPGWKARQIKDILVSTAKTAADQTVYQQGGGRLDVARAVRQGVTATGAVDLGYHEGDDDQPGGDITYTNGTGTSVKLTLTAGLANVDGGPSPEGAISLGSSEVTVEAGASVAVPVRAALSKVPTGRYGGYVSAVSADGTVALHTTLALFKRGRLHNVHFTAVDRNGKPTPIPVITMYGASSLDDVWAYIDREHADTGITVRVSEGTYMTQGVFDPTQSAHPVDSLVVMPELQVTGDMDVVLDARKANPITIKTPRPVVQDGIFTYFTHRTIGNRKISQGVMDYPVVEQLAVTPTQPVKEGSFEFASRWQLAAPKVSARLAGSGEPVTMSLLARSPQMDGVRRWPLVDGGAGTPEELSRLKLRGRAVIVSPPDRGYWEDRIAAAGAAGAAAVIVVGEKDGSVWQPWTPDGDRYPLPTFAVAHDHARKLYGAGRAVLEVSVNVVSPYYYDIMQVSPGEVPEHIVHEVTDRNTARVDTAYAQSGGFAWAKEQRFGWRPWQIYGLGFQMEQQRIVRTPLERAEYVSTGDTQWRHIVQHMFTWDNMFSLRGGLTERPRGYKPGEVVRETWFGPVVRPAIPAAVPAPTRSGDALSVVVPEFADSSGHFGYAGGSDEQDTTSARFYRNGELVEERSEIRGDFPAVPEEAEYRLELSTRRSSEEWTHATATETAWTFRSKAGQAALDLPQVDYDVPADLNGQVSRGLAKLSFAVRTPSAGPAAVKTFGAEVSYDDGKTWTRLVTVPTGGGRYTTLVAHPPLKQVSLRVSAEDAAGGRIEQTVIRAYGVK
ncbi:S8 family peptidase [Planotetraspora sp. A-T 1434]|uniref:S8 family peptidase n=1 Tax=Planotetraspora sp. A-T 1434 TaxID=2979219 RepID=UPI0021BFD794|nr:S8 family peptidase [Planotetraspora sp. A-T 1434]MCT9930767.1 S8 family peptidase [Planotetraspora sp. A-T 1434]